MASNSDSLVDERLVAQIEVAEHRLRAFRAHLDDADDETRARLLDRADGFEERCARLRTTLSDVRPVPIGTPTAVQDLGAAMDTLEADRDAAIEAEPVAYLAAVDRQARAWQSRTDRLRVQASLGVMELKDDFEALARRLDHVRAAAMVELNEVADDTRHAVEDLRDDMEQVVNDIRRAIDRAVDAIGGPG